MSENLKKKNYLKKKNKVKRTGKDTGNEEP